MPDQRGLGRQPKLSLIRQALEIEATSARQAGAIGYMARALVQTTLPHRKREGSEFVRRNGSLTLSVLAPAHVGLPYGSVPRLIMAWITTEVVRTGDREIVLGDTLSDFMRQLGMVPTGGRWGTVTRLRDQMSRLFASSITYTDSSERGFSVFSHPVADAARLWWDPRSPEQVGRSRSTIVLGEQFYRDLATRPIPVDMRALRALKGSPMALDVYCWLTYRLGYLRNPMVIPWGALQAQLGTGYGRTRDFKAAFLRALQSVLNVYWVSVQEMDSGLLLKPSRTHIPRCGKPCG